MPIMMRTGDLFDSTEQTLVNTVNCVGVMGKGIALEFKKRFPAMYKDYVLRCKLPAGHKEKLVVGKPYVFEGQGRLVLNFPTKDHWRYPSKIEWIERGLEYFAEHYETWGISSIAFPRLGCENGGLDWDSQVKPVMMRKLLTVAIPVVIVSRTAFGAETHPAPAPPAIEPVQPPLPQFEPVLAVTKPAKARRRTA